MSAVGAAGDLDHGRLRFRADDRASDHIPFERAALGRCGVTTTPAPCDVQPTAFSGRTDRLDPAKPFLPGRRSDRAEPSRRRRRLKGDRSTPRREAGFLCPSRGSGRPSRHPGRVRPWHDERPEQCDHEHQEPSQHQDDGPFPERQEPDRGDDVGPHVVSPMVSVLDANTGMVRSVKRPCPYDWHQSGR